VGDGGLQAAEALLERRQIQENIRHFHRLQEHCIKARQRAETLEKYWGSE